MDSFASRFLSDLELVSNEHVDNLILFKYIIELLYCLVNQQSTLPSILANMKKEMDQNMNVIKYIQDELKIIKENQENILKQTFETQLHFENMKKGIEQNTNKTHQYFQNELKILKEDQKDIKEHTSKIPSMVTNIQNEISLIKKQINDTKNVIKFPRFLEKPQDFEPDIFKACRDGKLSSVQWLIEIEKVDKNKKLENDNYIKNNFTNDTPIHIASTHGHLPIVQYLIEKQNVDINIFGHGKNRPLSKACRYGHLHIVEYLISKDADIQFGGASPLHEASRKGHIDIVKYLISVGANINAKNQKDETPYDVAANSEIRNILKDNNEHKLL